MKTPNKEILKRAAENMLFEMTEEECETLLKEFEIILAQMEHIGSLPDVDKIEPMTFPYEVRTSCLREDVPSEPLSREDVLKNAGDVSNGQIKLPKVVG